jgi:hypothetical protein
VNPEVMAEWFRRQDHRVVRTASSWWYDAGARVYQAFPFHWSFRPLPDEAERLLRGVGGLALRFTTPLDAPEGRVSYHVVCDDRGYGLERLDGRARNAVRNGSQRARVEVVPLERLAEEGWALEVDTCRRQGRAVPWSRGAWRRRCLAAADLPGFEAWGALVEGRLAASLLAVRVDGWCEVLGQQSLSEYLAARVNNALTFGFTRAVLQRPGVASIFYSLQSLDAPPSVDDFKLRMGYRPAPVRQRVVLHPWARPFVGPWAPALVASALRRRPGSRVLAKAEGMLRFYVEGLAPAERQEWPACLERAQPRAAEAGVPGVRPAPAPAPRPTAGPGAPASRP